MRRNRFNLIAIFLAVAATGFASDAQARDFFSNFFSGFTGERQSRAPQPQQALPFASDFFDFGEQQQPAPRVSASRGSAYCVRTCDGKYFPLTGTGGQSRAETCNSLCPASETKVYYGSTIDNANTDGGKPYSSLTNAFKYRNELVAGCTCNGKDAGGLARIKIEDDPTVRRGDLVAGKDGILVATGGASKRGASANFSPVSRSARAQLPVVATQ